MAERADGEGPSAVLIAGPTASGKSALAIEFARRRNGAIVNADAMQVYRELRVLTARPSTADEAKAPHLLFGHVPAATRYSVGRWCADVADALAEARAGGLMPIIVGGTGLYFKALTEGLATIPPISDEVRADVGRLAESLDNAALHHLLAASSPEDAARIRPTDRARIVRALEVYKATGRPLMSWHRSDHSAPLIGPGLVQRLVIMPDRSLLHEQIAARAEAMVEDGGLSEVEALMGLDLPAALPAMKAIGVRQLAACLGGAISRDEALTSIKTATRRYAKRQSTWFRNQMPEWPFVADTQSALDLLDRPA